MRTLASEEPTRRMKRNEKAPWSGVLVTDEAFRYFAEHDHASEMLQAKIEELTMSNIRCQDRPTLVQEGNTVFMAGAVGFALGLLAMGFALKH